jgi:hypothetical protein
VRTAELRFVFRRDDDERARQPRLSCPVDDRLQVLFELVACQVAVGVNVRSQKCKVKSSK